MVDELSDDEIDNVLRIGYLNHDVSAMLHVAIMHAELLEEINYYNCAHS